MVHFSYLRFTDILGLEGRREVWLWYHHPLERCNFNSTPEYYSEILVVFYNVWFWGCRVSHHVNVPLDFDSWHGFFVYIQLYRYFWHARPTMLQDGMTYTHLSSLFLFVFLSHLSETHTSLPVWVALSQFLAHSSILPAFPCCSWRHMTFPSSVHRYLAIYS